jgi:Fic family protein
MQLGELRSKVQHLARLPLRPDKAEELQRVMLRKGALASVQIEGSSLSDEQAARIDEGIRAVPPSQEYLEQEYRNVVAAHQELIDFSLRLDLPRLTVGEILRYNEAVWKGVAVEGFVPGEVRSYDMSVGSVYHAPPPDKCPGLLDRLVDWLEGPLRQCPEGHEDEWQIPVAIVRGVLAHLYVAWIHPFGDGNGRTARLLEFRVLLAAGVPAPAAHLLSNYYNDTRQRYYEQLRMASRESEGVYGFVAFAINGLLEYLREQLEELWQQTWELAWRDHVHRLLPGDETQTRRKRQLVFALSEHKGPIFELDDLRELNEKTRTAYSGLTDKTLRRDIADLAGLRLVAVVRVKDRTNAYVANEAAIQRFRPVRHEEAIRDYLSVQLQRASKRR